MLYEHQKRAIQHIGKHKNTTINYFCGTGKTRIVYQLFKELCANKLAIIVFPSIALITQFTQDYIVKDYSEFNLLNVCSVDECQLSVKFTADFYTVCKFLLNPVVNRKTVLAVTYKSLPVVIKSIIETAIRIKYMVFDEAHHITDKSIVKTLFIREAAKDFDEEEEIESSEEG